MKFAHNIVIKLFENEFVDDNNLDLSSFEKFLTEDVLEILNSEDEKKLKKEKIEIEIEKLNSKDALKTNKPVSIIDGVDLTIIRMKFSKDKIINEILKIMKDKLGKEQCALVSSQENRVDDNCNFYIRFDKDLLEQNKFALTDSGNCLHFKIKLAAYPNKKEVGLNLVKKILE